MPTPEQFTNQAQTKLNEKLFKTEASFPGEFPRLSAGFKENFRQVCEKIAELDDIAYIEYTLLRTSIINKNYTAEVRVYGEDWYFCKNQQAVGEFDVSFLFKHFDDLWGELIDMRKQFTGKVSAADVKEFMMDAAPKFYAYVISLCRFSILDCVERDYFKALKKSPKFEINVGEYMAQTQVVYKENAEKNRGEILEWFADRLNFAYCFEDFSGLDLSGENLSEIDLRYADLRNCELKDVNFIGSNLTGARFCGANLENADFSYSNLYEADFSGANLQNAKFNHVMADSGMFGEVEWQRPGYFGVSFKNADLRGTDFTNANFGGRI